LDRAIAAIDRLLERPSLSRDEDDYLDVLSDLVFKYEQAVHPLAPVGSRQSSTRKQTSTRQRHGRKSDESL